MRTRFITSALALALVAGAAIPSAQAGAETSETQAGQAERPQSAGEASPATPERASDEVAVSGAEVAAFAEAASAIEQIQRAHVSDMQAAQEAGDQARLQEIMTKVRDEALAEIDEIERLNAERYSEIARSVRGDPELRERVMAEIRALE